MPVVFVIDDSAKEPSLVRRLIAEGYHVLCLVDGESARQTLRCMRPNLLVADLAWLGRAEAAKLLKMLHVDAVGGERARVPALLVGAKLSDFRVLTPLLGPGEILPAIDSSPETISARVRRHTAPGWPTRTAGSLRVAELPWA